MISNLKFSTSCAPPKTNFSDLSAGGQKRERVKILSNVVKGLGGNNVVSQSKILDALLARNDFVQVKHKMESHVAQNFTTTMSKIANCHEKAPSHLKPQFLSLVSHFSGPELRNFGFKFSGTSLSNARKHAQNHIPGLPRPHFTPPSKREKSQKLKNAIYAHLMKNSSPMANDTTKLDGKNVPSRGVIDSWTFLYHNFCETNTTGETLCETTWRKIVKGFKIFKKARKQTDMCEICANGKKILSQLAKLEREHPGITSDPLALEVNSLSDASQNSEFEEHLLIKVQGLLREKNFYENHVSGKNLQREAFNKEVDDLKQNLAGDKAVVILDFKQNVTLNGGPVELSYQFFEKTQQTVLGFVVLTHGDNGSVKKTYVNFVSSVLNHDALFVSDCMKKLVALPEFSSVKTVSFWTDTGPHFRCGEFAHCVFDTLFSITSLTKVSWNLFLEKHGKNMCDSHFSSLSKWLESAELESHIETTDDLISAWKRQIEKDNFVLRKKGKVELDVKFLTITRSVRPKSKKVIKIPTIKSFYSFERSKGDSFLLVKVFSKDSCVRKIDIHEISCTEVRTGMNKLKRAKKFPKHSPHYTNQQMSTQERGVTFRSPNFDVSSKVSPLFSKPLAPIEISNLRTRTIPFEHVNGSPQGVELQKRVSPQDIRSSVSQNFSRSKKRKNTASSSQRKKLQKISRSSPRSSKPTNPAPTLKLRRKRKRSVVGKETVSRVTRKRLKRGNAPPVRKILKKPLKLPKSSLQQEVELKKTKIGSLSKKIKKKTFVTSGSCGNLDFNKRKTPRNSRFITRSNRPFSQ